MKNWWRRYWHVCLVGGVIAVGAEQRSCAASTLTLPAAAGDWTLVAPQDCHKPVPADLHAWDGVAAARRVCYARYKGAPDVALTVFDMPGGPAATAFDAFQRWRTQPGKMGFFQGGIFGVAEAPETDKSALNRFIVALETTLPPGNEARR